MDAAAASACQSELFGGRSVSVISVPLKLIDSTSVVIRSLPFPLWRFSAGRAWFPERVPFSDRTSARTDYACNCAPFRLVSRSCTPGQRSWHRKHPPCTQGGSQDVASCSSALRDIPPDRIAYGVRKQRSWTPGLCLARGTKFLH